MMGGRQIASCSRFHGFQQPQRKQKLEQKHSLTLQIAWYAANARGFSASLLTPGSRPASVGKARLHPLCT